MAWFNLYGLAFVLVMMIPNIVFAAKNKDGFQNLWSNKMVEGLEQIGRVGCFVLMVLVIPGCGFGFLSEKDFAFYLILNTVLTAAYCLIWIICFKRNSVWRALALSILPSLIFMGSGALSRYWPLLIASMVFAPCHVAISYQNAVLEAKRKRPRCRNDA